jgi:hypothetical protein
MMAGGLSTKADSNLLEQLDALGSSTEPFQVWFRLAQVPGSAEDPTSLANSVVERVKKHIGEEVQSFKVLPNLNSFMVSASPDFVRELIDQPEIESARSTNVAGFGLIKPVKVTPVQINPGGSVSQSARSSHRLRRHVK